MALPHLPTTYTTRKNIYETAIVQRRNKENDFITKWTDNANYFHKSNITVNKQKNWESSACFNGSMDAWKATRDTESKRIKLQNRRLQLAKLLKDERMQLEAELRDLTQDRSSSRLGEMKERSDCLKSSREEKRQKNAEMKLYDHWKTNNSYLRQVESEQHQKHVIATWREQLEQQDQQREEARREEDARELEREMVRQAALQLQQEEELNRLKEEKQFKCMLRDQVAELRERERQAELLKRQEEMLIRERWELEELETLQKKQEQERKKMEFGKVLLRQHAAALRRRSKQVQKELEEDQCFLEALVRQEKEERGIVTSRKEKARADATWMKQVVEEQLRLEKSREAELNMMYHDEAAKIWEKRESEWARERIARQRLMHEVLGERQVQIEAKMVTVREQQEESLRQREKLVQELEAANRLTQEGLEREEERKEARKLELKSQMTSRRDHDESEKLMLRLELEDDADEQDDYDKLLKEEAERITARGYEPTDRGRKQAWM